jgi:uncharacterized protein (DUF1800 family)
MPQFTPHRHKWPSPFPMKLLNSTVKISLSVSFSSIAWCSGCAIASAVPADARILHLLDRLSFGAKAGDLERVRQMGIDRYIQSQLNPDTVAENPLLTERLNQLETLNLSPVELFQKFNPNRDANGNKPALDIVKIRRQNVRIILSQALQAKWQRGIHSNRQLQEVTIDFWFNHFNIDANKGLNRMWIGAYEREAIRPYIFGKFRDLLGATAKHPGMLYYLDNWQNSVDRPEAKGRFKGLNENYARELMELHTLGVKGGYTQQDVVALAKIFTGWGFKQPGNKISDGYTFEFNPRRHDFSNKVFLGKSIPGSGMSEGETALDMLASHPSTARHLSYKLAQYFVADNPPKSLVNKLSKQYLATNGDLRSVLNTLFKSKEFWDTKYYQKKYKTPYQYALSSVRAAGIEVNVTAPLDNFLKQMGMSLYSCPTPDGYKNTQTAWLNPDSLTRRLNFATNLASGKLSLSVPQLTSANPRSNSTPIPINADRLIATLGNRFSPRTLQTIANSSEDLKAALILGSPEFMYK